MRYYWFEAITDVAVTAVSVTLLGIGLITIVKREDFPFDSPAYKAGTCLKVVQSHGNEFEPKTYEFIRIEVVGKKSYKYTVFKDGYSFEMASPFHYVDSYIEPQIIECSFLNVKE